MSFVGSNLSLVKFNLVQLVYLSNEKFLFHLFLRHAIIQETSKLAADLNLKRSGHQTLSQVSQVVGVRARIDFDSIIRAIRDINLRY